MERKKKWIRRNSNCHGGGSVGVGCGGKATFRVDVAVGGDWLTGKRVKVGKGKGRIGVDVAVGRGSVGKGRIGVGVAVGGGKFMGVAVGAGAVAGTGVAVGAGLLAGGVLVGELPVGGGTAPEGSVGGGVPAGVAVDVGISVGGTARCCKGTCSRPNRRPIGRFSGWNLV